MSATFLDLPAGALDDLRAALGGEPRPDAAELHAAGLLRDGRPDPARAAELAPLAAPEWQLLLEAGDAGGEGWTAAGRLVLHTPGDDGVDRVALLPADLLPGTLATLVDLGPRPHAEGAAPLRVRAGDLALALARSEPEVTGPLAAIVVALRVRWRVEARRPGDRRVVEALDTAEGLWLIVPDGPEVDLLPVTPTRVFRLLVALAPPY